MTIFFFNGKVLDSPEVRGGVSGGVEGETAGAAAGPALHPRHAGHQGHLHQTHPIMVGVKNI